MAFRLQRLCLALLGVLGRSARESSPQKENKTRLLDRKMQFEEIYLTSTVTIKDIYDCHASCCCNAHCPFLGGSEAPACWVGAKSFLVKADRLPTARCDVALR